MSTGAHAPLSVGRMLRSHCPHCGSGEIWRTHRKSIFDWLMSPLTIRPYRCWECSHRFHAVPAWRLLAPSPRENRAGQSRGLKPTARHSLKGKHPKRSANLIRWSIIGIITLALVIWFLISLAMPPTSD